MYRKCEKHIGEYNERKTWDVRMSELETAVVNTAMAKGLHEGKHGGDQIVCFLERKRGEEQVQKVTGHN